MTTLAGTYQERAPLLRRLLVADGALSAAMGAALTMAAGPVAALTGLPAAALTALGIALVLWGAWVAYAGARLAAPRRAGQAVSVVNFAWVLASVIILFGGLLPLTTAGWWLVAAMAVAVDLLAVGQWLAARRGL